MQSLDLKTAVAYHAKGVNQDLPASCMIYIKVADLDASVAQVVKLSGGVLITIKNSGKI